MKTVKGVQILQQVTLCAALLFFFCFRNELHHCMTTQKSKMLTLLTNILSKNIIRINAGIPLPWNDWSVLTPPAQLALAVILTFVLHGKLQKS